MKSPGPNACCCEQAASSQLLLDNDREEHYSREEHILFQRSSRFKLGKLEFMLRYEFSDELEYRIMSSYKLTAAKPSAGTDRLSIHPTDVIDE